jgi:predicted protein tyrosine phosphatase
MYCKIRRVLFVSQRQAEAMRPPLHSCIVSITDTKRPGASLRQGWNAVLCVAFDDADPITFPGANPELTALSSSQARNIARFVLDQAPTSQRLVVHCRHGVSRSAAVAKAVAVTQILCFPEQCDEYNHHVYKMMLEALQGAT